MQPHPDRSDLTLYLRGNAPVQVATVVREHLLACDQCVGDALVVYDELDQLRAGLAKRQHDHDLPPATSLIPAARATIVVDARKPAARYEWLALAPIALAASLMWATRVTTDESHPVHSRIAQVAESHQIARLSAPVQTPTDAAKATPASSSDDDNLPVQPVKRRSSPPQTQETRIAKVFIFATQPRARHASDPVLLQPIETVNVSFRTDTSHKPAALALLASAPSVTPPPQRPAGLKKVFSVLAAPFRKS